MKQIHCPTKALYHTLTHFSQINIDMTQELCNAGYPQRKIDEQLNQPGSKFLISFATSPKEVVDILRQKFPIVFETVNWESDGKSRLSFLFNKTIGNCQLIHEDELTPLEFEAIRKEVRNGCDIRVASSTREFPTNECQLILCGSSEYPVLWTLFPGKMAPPLPKIGESADIFWQEHLFLSDKK